MILKWINSIRREGKVERAAESENSQGQKPGQNAKLIDVAHEALAARDRATLEYLVKMGWPYVKRERFKVKVRKKVWQLVDDAVGSADTDMVEEITEKITEVAEADDYYQTLFDKEELPKE